MFPADGAVGFDCSQKEKDGKKTRAKCNDGLCCGAAYTTPTKDKPDPMKQDNRVEVCAGKDDKLYTH